MRALKSAGWPVKGKALKLLTEIFVAVGNPQTRKHMECIRIGQTCAYPSNAVVARDAAIGSGTAVMAGAAY